MSLHKQTVHGVSLQSLKNRDLSHPLIADILCRVHVLLSRDAQVAFKWVSSHVGLAGNSAAAAGK
jgi:ribonuclease HI